jgi:hypothetical protein
MQNGASSAACSPLLWGGAGGGVFEYMTCYVDFFPPLCPNCGRSLDWERDAYPLSSPEALEGRILLCSCGLECWYLPEHRFPYRSNDDTAETV